MANGAGSFEKAFEELIRRVLREEVASGALGGAAVARAAVPGESVSSSGPGIGAVNQAVNGILQPTGQTDIMAATLRGALALAGRSVLFVRKGDCFSAWRAEGYSGQTATAMRSVTVSATQPGIFKDVCDAQGAVCRQRSAGTLPKELEQALGSAVGPNLCLLPIFVQGKVVAALYTDAGGSAGSEEMHGLEIIARVAGLSLETAGSRASKGSAQTAVAESPASAPVESATLEPAAPVAASAQVESPPTRGSFVDSFPVATEGAPALPPPPDADSLPDAERDSHKKAHRFARVAVQDLLSYHRDKIEQGRKNKNLFTLLKEDIEKTRENYQKRFGETPAQTFDYLHYEMVSKLAGNDVSVLGDQYPGPWQS